jgi:mono/diheme cytochrome c family protein
VRQAFLIIALSIASAAAMTPVGPPAKAVRPFDPAVERGHSLASRRCAECHAIGRGRDSPDGDAPRFVTLSLRFNALSLERRLTRTLRGEHAGMPPVGLSDEDRKDLAVYIESLRSPEG